MYSYRTVVDRGMGQEVDFSSLTKSFSTAIKPMVQEIVSELRPHLNELVREASDAAAPTVAKLLREEVMPKAGMYLLGVGLGAALIGAIACRLVK